MCNHYRRHFSLVLWLSSVFLGLVAGAGLALNLLDDGWLMRVLIVVFPLIGALSCSFSVMFAIRRVGWCKELQQGIRSIRGKVVVATIMSPFIGAGVSYMGLESSDVRLQHVLLLASLFLVSACILLCVTLITECILRMTSR